MTDLELACLVLQQDDGLACLFDLRTQEIAVRILSEAAETSPTAKLLHDAYAEVQNIRHQNVGLILAFRNTDSDKARITQGAKTLQDALAHFKELVKAVYNT